MGGVHEHHHERAQDATTAEGQPHERLDASSGHDSTSQRTKPDTTASPTYCEAMIAAAGTRVPRIRTSIACGVRLNQVTVCSTRKRHATAFSTTSQGESAQSRKSSYAACPRPTARTSSSR